MLWKDKLNSIILVNLAFHSYACEVLVLECIICATHGKLEESRRHVWWTKVLILFFFSYSFFNLQKKGYKIKTLFKRYVSVWKITALKTLQLIGFQKHCTGIDYWNVWRQLRSSSSFTDYKQSLCWTINWRNNFIAKRIFVLYYILSKDCYLSYFLSFEPPAFFLFETFS